MIDGGVLTITLSSTEDRLAVRVDAPPMLSLSRMLAGKPTAEAAQLAAVVHSGAPAAEASGILAASGGEAAESVLRGIVVEIVRDHAAKLLQSWPAMLGLAPEAVPGPGPLDPDLMARCLFGDGPPPQRLTALDDWIHAAPTVAARALGTVWRHWDGRWGRAQLPLWSSDRPLGLLDWDEALMDGEPFEIGLPARVADTDLMREAEARRGRGLAWRLLARLVDSTVMLDRLRRDDLDGLVRRVAPGVAAAPLANGTLLVSVEVADGAVTRYRRLSPADAALHPRGLLARVLSTLPCRSRAPLGTVAGMAVESVAPALPARVILSQAA